MNWPTLFVINWNKKVSLDAKNGQIKNIRNIFIKIERIELCDIIPMKMTREYITAKENVSMNIEERNETFQYPNLSETISHTPPRR